MKVDPRDPFGERKDAGSTRFLSILGARCTVRSVETALLDQASHAFGNLPHLPVNRNPSRLQVRLILTNYKGKVVRGTNPPEPILSSGSGLLCATLDAGNFALIDPESSRALVGVSPSMLRHPYHVRYELIEFALITLASRTQELVPLHAACVGRNGAGILLMGPSGTGKSTLCLHGISSGLKILSEDSAFIQASAVLVTGTSNFLHIDKETPNFLEPGPLKRQIEESPVIQRRSGARKYELDLRSMRSCIVREPLHPAATVFLSRKSSALRSALKRLSKQEMLTRLRREQPYAIDLPHWRRFEKRIAAIPAFELRRTGHPESSIYEIRKLLDYA